MKNSINGTLDMYIKVRRLEEGVSELRFLRRFNHLDEFITWKLNNNQNKKNSRSLNVSGRHLEYLCKSCRFKNVSYSQVYFYFITCFFNHLVNWEVSFDSFTYSVNAFYSESSLCVGLFCSCLVCMPFIWIWCCCLVV